MKDLIKDWITDGIGLGIWIIAGIMLYCKELSVWPDATILFVIGALMFYVPDEWVTKHLKEWIKKKFGK